MFSPDLSSPSPPPHPPGPSIPAATPVCSALTTRLRARHALLLVFLVWSAIYLPALGTLEIKGEEGRRLLPAITMLQTGRWVVPSIGGVDYLSKPPLLNWLAAAAFQISGSRSEWAARAPSALSVLILALATVWTLSAALTPAGALLAAVFMLTNIGLMEKGRLAEIEALYTCLFGLALLTWLSGWLKTTNNNTVSTPAPLHPWRTWTLPGLFLGLGLLTKGPLTLIYYYVIVTIISVRARRWRELGSPAHWVGLAATLLIFAAWAYPYLRATSVGHAGAVWRAQMQGRLEITAAFRWQDWLLNIPRSLINYLPWTLLLPLLWFPKAKEDAPSASAQPQPPPSAFCLLPSAFFPSARLATTLCFLAASLAPGGAPRYTLPLLVPASILLALVCVRIPASIPPILPIVWSRVVGPLLGLSALAALPGAFAGGADPWRWAVAALIVAGGLFLLVEHYRFRRWGGIPVLALSSAGVMALLTADYSLGAASNLRRSENLRAIGQKINRGTAASGEAVRVLAPGYLPFLYYVHPDPVSVQTPAELPSTAHFLLVRETDLPTVANPLKTGGRSTQTLLRLNDKNRGRWYLLRVGAGGKPGL